MTSDCLCAKDNELETLRRLLPTRFFNLVVILRNCNSRKTQNWSEPSIRGIFECSTTQSNGKSRMRMKTSGVWKQTDSSLPLRVEAQLKIGHNYCSFVFEKKFSKQKAAGRINHRWGPLATWEVTSPWFILTALGTSQLRSTLVPLIRIINSRRLFQPANYRYGCERRGWFYQTHLLNCEPHIKRKLTNLLPPHQRKTILV